jgi:hypothetical protein
MRTKSDSRPLLTLMLATLMATTSLAAPPPGKGGGGGGEGSPTLQDSVLTQRQSAPSEETRARFPLGLFDSNTDQDV